ncbi:MAG: DNA methyltransferase [Gammaproteobacteria bacterium]|nr:DNA methyltransferase [Gammaproteobacteria bacterium]
MNALPKLKQRVEYTHKYNTRSGRHGWLRLTPAYSVKIVEELLAKYDGGGPVLDPFCGSGTTALCAAQYGLPSTTTDINPFLVWLAQVKTRKYNPTEVASARNALETLLARMGKDFDLAPVPPIHKIERWWSDCNLTFLRELRGAIDGLGVPQAEKDLLDVAFCRTLIKLSNASFNHQSMSFKDNQPELSLVTDAPAIYRADASHVLETCQDDIHSDTTVCLQDARLLDSDSLGKFDLVITSPPYANRMSYIRELRPYMYWLRYLHEPREAGELDWLAIGGTWGVATSRLNGWTIRENYRNDHLSSVVAAISGSHNRHAETLSRYVRKYCEDMFAHLSSLARVLRREARIHYIVGNSTFYGTLVSVERLYADMMEKVGFSNIDIRAIRKRNSKKELVEFVVSATW